MKDYTFFTVALVIVGLAGWGIGLRQGQMDAYAEVMKWKATYGTHSLR